MTKNKVQILILLRSKNCPTYNIAQQTQSQDFPKSAQIDPFLNVITFFWMYRLNFFADLAPSLHPRWGELKMLGG